MIDRVIIWTSGGLAVGCVIGICVTKVIHDSNNRNRLLEREGHTEDDLSNNGSKKFDDRITTYSELTMLMGSPTPSSVLNAREYPQYPADTSYPDLRRNRTIMARYLTKEMYEDLYSLQTSSGYNLDGCIQTGIDNPDKFSCGIVAGDEECYDLFSSLYDPIITDRHRGFICGKKKTGNINVNDLKSDPFDPKYVKSTHFLVGRCFQGFRFPPSCGRAERKHIEKLIKSTLESLDGEFSGTYIHLSDLSLDQRYHLPDILQSVVDCPASCTLVSSGSTRDWPSGRGVFYSNDSNFFAWTNREDHLRVMYRDRAPGFIESYKQFIKGMEQFEEKMMENSLEFSQHEHYGYLLTCPSGIGTALRAGVHMKLPNLLRDQRFRSILKNLRLHMGAENQEMLRKGYVDVYNMDRLGYVECHLVQHVADSVHLLSDMERRLERKQSITDLIVIKDPDE